MELKKIKNRLYDVSVSKILQTLHNPQRMTQFIEYIFREYPTLLIQNKEDQQYLKIYKHRNQSNVIKYKLILIILFKYRNNEKLHYMILDYYFSKKQI